MLLAVRGYSSVQQDYQIQKYLKENIIAFGMEGDYGYFFDYREPGEPKIIGCNFGDLDIMEVKPEADKFEDFIKDWLWLLMKITENQVKYEKQNAVTIQNMGRRKSIEERIPAHGI